MQIIRTWKRDGSTNEMALAVALRNLLDRDVTNALRGELLRGDAINREVRIQMALCNGEILQTKFAYFCRDRRDCLDAVRRLRMHTARHGEAA